jgi:hypothetical protein
VHFCAAVASASTALLTALPSGPTLLWASAALDGSRLAAADSSSETSPPSARTAATSAAWAGATPDGGESAAIWSAKWLVAEANVCEEEAISPRLLVPAPPTTASYFCAAACQASASGTSLSA